MIAEINMCEEAYESGKEAARDPRNAVEIPLRYANQAQRNAYLDGFAQMREDMADAIARAA